VVEVVVVMRVIVAGRGLDVTRLFCRRVAVVTATFAQFVRIEGTLDGRRCTEEAIGGWLVRGRCAMLRLPVRGR
jgi:hypothetical protein